MSKTIKKALSILLCAALLFGAAPLNGFVGLQLPSLSSLFAVKAQAASGTCGTNLTWNYDEATATLTISGRGTMNTYSLASYNGTNVTTAPWKVYYQTMRTVVINSGVASVGSFAFACCSGLTNVTIGNDVTSLSEYAFAYCPTLSDVVIGNSVTIIGNRAFCDCASLSNVNIPDSVAVIDARAFNNCSSLTSITIPNGVTSIGAYAFNGCSGLTSMTIPDSVTSIGNNTFYNCTGLTSMTLPFVGESRTATTTNGVFGYVFGATSSNISGTVQQFFSSNKSFYYYIPSSLREITITDATRLSYGAFYNCSFLSTITIPDSVTSIDNYAFFNCSGLTSITIPNSITSIGDYAFSGCTGLTAVYYSGTQEQWNAIEIGANNEPLQNVTFQSAEHIHAYTSAVTKEPTCAEEGIRTYTCECGSSYTEPIAKLPHMPKTVTVPATCTENGRYYDVCEICGERLSEDTIIPATGHHYDDGVVTQEPTCTQAGVKTYTCGDCGHTYTEPVAKLPHTPKTVTVPATCTENGRYYDVCEICGERLSEDTTIPATGHHYDDGVVTQESTCTQTGVKTYTCGDCGHAYTETIPVGPHTPTDWIVLRQPVACSSTGLRVRICMVCGETLETEEIPIPHRFGDWAVSTAATCTTAGEETRICADCGTTETRAVAALGHDHVSTVIAPTCTEGGYTAHVCSRCGDTYTTDITPAKGHTASDWQMVINPTATTDGKMCKYCVDCGVVMDEMTVPMLAGTHVTGVALSASEAYLDVGETLTLTATVTPSSAVDQTVLWLSSDPDVATVENGVVTPVAPGTAVIIVQTTDRGYKDYCVVQVSAVAPQNGAVVSNGMIYGLNVNLSDLNEYLNPADMTMSVEAESAVIGTGTKVYVKQSDTVLNEFEVVIFGDVDGNGWYDGTDAYFVSLVANGLISPTALTNAQRMAADCNHDGVIDAADVALLEQAGLLLANVDQTLPGEELETNSVYLKYCGLIDQTVEIIEPASAETNEPATEQGSALAQILSFFRLVFAFLRKLLFGALV